MRFGSLFAGIGGLDLGLERAGMECIWQVEIDDYCTKVLEKHWPDVRRYRNVREVGSNLEPVDLIAGGFPCQPHSVAGKQLGEEDDRNLWPEFIRVIRETKPRYVLAENVPGIITTYLDMVLSDLEGEGYDPWPFTFAACGFDAPHKRERIFIVAYTASKRCREEGADRSRSEKRIARSGAASEDVADSVCTRGREDTRSSSRYEKKNEGWGTENNNQLTSDGEGSRAEDVADSQDAYGRRASETEHIRRRNPQTRRCSIGRDRETYWAVEPNVGRVAHGIPSRVDRLRGLGNAVVPQVAQWIGERIIEHSKTMSTLDNK